MNDFMYMVQTHERSWGNKQYKARPSLESIMSSEVVVCWKVPETPNPVLTCYDSIAVLQKYFARMLILNMMPTRQIVSIWQSHKRVKIVSVQIKFGDYTKD